LEFREERGGTLIRTAGNQALPSHGHFTIDLATGRVLSSELIAESGSLRARIEVTYALEPAMELFVPREMKEKYSLGDARGSMARRPTRGFGATRSPWRRR
jgi:hypothetical protein